MVGYNPILYKDSVLLKTYFGFCFTIIMIACYVSIKSINESFSLYSLSFFFSSSFSRKKEREGKKNKRRTDFYV